MNINYILKRAVAEVIVKEEMTKLLQSGRKLRLKLGLDPSAPDITLGHTVVLRKLRQLQELGHQVILIVGDWTAQIGDPSGTSITRPMLSMEQVQINAETYMKQFFKVVDKSKTEVRWQSEWFGKFTLTDVIQLTSKFTVAQLMAREDFSNRYGAGHPIAITELLYPLLQAYDSVAIKADVEFGGTDQKFNLLVGRELQSTAGQPPQQIFLVPLLVGTDGKQKMSKSLGNYIGVAEPPNEIYGKVMSISDDLLLTYFELLTDVPDEELKEFAEGIKSESVNPMNLKKRLAGEIVTQLYSQKDAGEAEDYFSRTVQKKEVPDEVPEYNIRLDQLESKQAKYAEQAQHTNFTNVDVGKLLVKTRLVASRSEANRLISQRAVEIDGNRVHNNVHPIKTGSIIKVGKRRFARVKLIL